MHLIDWTFVEGFFGQYGKLLVAVIALVVGVISLTVAMLKYLKAKILETERNHAREERNEARAALDAEKMIVQEQRKTLELNEAEFGRKNAALEQAAHELRQQRNKIEVREEKLEQIRTAFVGKEHDLWCIHPTRRPDGYDAKMKHQREKPIITVANLKGGVGKTTLTANLAAFFSERGKRVLLVDVDYQGSLSNMLLSADQVLDVSPKINELLEHGADIERFRAAVHRFRNVINGSSLVSAKYELASLENRLMIEYLLQEDKDDGRYRLANILLSSEVSATFDLVLIDAPPRLTAGTINAFCASTHLLIPTVYDNLSAETVGTFLNGVQVLRDHLNHRIDLLGIVGMLTSTQGDLNAREQQAKNIAGSDVQRTWGANHHFFARHIPRRAAIAASAGQSLAYFSDPTVKGWFVDLGEDIARRLALPPRLDGGERNTRAPRSAHRSDEPAIVNSEGATL